MSQRAACQLERFGLTDVFDFVTGKAYWRASGRPTVRATPADRVSDHLAIHTLTVDVGATVHDARRAPHAALAEQLDVVNAYGVVLGSVQVTGLNGLDPAVPIAAVMTLGPATIRPDEDAATVRSRMRAHQVSSLVVTRPTGELIGVFSADEHAVGVGP